MRKYKLLKWLLLIIGLPLALCYSLQLYAYIRPPGAFLLDLKWQKDLGSSTYERPAYQDGLVLVPANGLLSSAWYGINAATGKVIWSQSLKRYSFRRCLSSNYLIVSGPQSLAALEPQSGKLLWQGKRAKAATCSQDAVFDVGTRGNIFASNISTGQRLWSGTDPRQSVLGVAYNSETNELIGGGAVIIDPTSGKVLRIFEPSFVAYPPTDTQYRGPMYLIDRNQLFVGNKVRNATTGQVIADIGRIGDTPPVIVAETIYIANGVEGVTARDRETFEVKWQYQPLSKLFDIPMDSISPVAVLDGIGYVIFLDLTLRAFDLETGGELGYWQPSNLDLLHQATCFPTMRPGCMRLDSAGMTTSEDTLFVSFGDGKLYAFGK